MAEPYVLMMSKNGGKIALLANFARKSKRFQDSEKTILQWCGFGGVIDAASDMGLMIMSIENLSSSKITSTDQYSLM